jgi:hypothetical protein
MLTFPVAPQPLQPIAGRDAQLRKVFHPVQLIQFPPNHRPQRLWAGTPRSAAVQTEKQVFRGLISE